MNHNITEWDTGADRTFGDSRVSKLALEAANQIDELMQGRHFEIGPVQKFAELITDSFTLDSGREAQSFVDSGTVALFSPSCG